jgi:hypothetical protein
MQAGMPGASASGAEPFGSLWSGQVTQRRGAELSGLRVLLTEGSSPTSREMVTCPGRTGT